MMCIATCCRSLPLLSRRYSIVKVPLGGVPQVPTGFQNVLASVPAS